MSWKLLPPTEKQIKILSNWKQPIPKTRGEASEVIGKWKDGTKFLCKTCGKLVRPEDEKISCCGITESIRPTGGIRDNHGRLHGEQPQIGTGSVVYTHGILTELDDGNGNSYNLDDESDEEYF
jgi:hypothetical protein